MRKLLKESEKHVLYNVLEKIRCQLNSQISVTFSVIFALKPGSIQAFRLSPAKFLSAKLRKNDRAPDLFI